jgi:tetratricopeptide (TPR) repeat protein/TolB-like protein
VIGETLSRYRIVERLGAGSMGEVYRAEDLRLGRPVALKLLRATDDARDAWRRLLVEARAASALNHPNIAVVYEVDEVERNGAWAGFIAMEFVAGRTLVDLSAHQALPLDQILDITRQIAAALAEAHAHGLIHRDIKPSNVMVAENGLVKVLDFGVARWSEPFGAAADAETRTEHSSPGGADIAGTLPYMSPEQATGRWVDGRSDMFSLGVLVYELLSGRRPFAGDNAAQVLESLLQGEVPALVPRLDDPRVPAVERVVRRMLARRPADRFEDLTAVREAFDAARRGEGALDAGPEPGAAILAVTDLRNITAAADDDWLGTGIAETITADLSGLARITVIPRGRVHEIMRTLSRRQDESETALLVRAGYELGAKWVLTGGFQRAGDAVRVTASLVDVATGQSVHTIKVDGRLTEIFPLQDRLVRELADGLRAVGGPLPASTPDTGIVGAYEAFTKGVINLRTESYESLDRSVLLFERAISLDPRYARAHLELGVAYATKADYLAMNELRQRAVASLRRALELEPGSVRAWRELGSVLMGMGQDAEGIEALQRALDLDPTDAGALGSMARAEFMGRARFDVAATWFERALAENPKGGWYALQLAHCAALLRDFVRGEASARRAIALQQASLSGQEGIVIVGGPMRLGHLQALQGRHQEAITQFLRELEWLASVDHALRGRIMVELNVRLGASYLALGEARKGRGMLDVAIEAFDRRVRLGADEPFTRYYAAAAHALRGDADTALAFLERAAAERRAFTLARARIEPEFEALRRDHRFERLVSSA